MKREELAGQANNPHFIGSWMLEPLSLCDKLVAHFETNKHHQTKGMSGRAVNPENKNSIDITMSPTELLLPENKHFLAYFDALHQCYQDYRVQWPFLEVFAEELHIGRFNLQRYQVGQHFQKVHTERSSLGTLHRLFAWMTYLNDVESEDGGSTFFSHFDLEIRPKKGLTLIWPSEWTHAHRGNVLRGNSKYIITGWMHFPA